MLFCLSAEQNRTNRVDFVRMVWLSTSLINRTGRKVSVRLFRLLNQLNNNLTNWVWLIFSWLCLISYAGINTQKSIWEKLLRFLFTPLYLPNSITAVLYYIMSLKTSWNSFNRCRMQLPDWLHALRSVITSLPSSSIFTGYLFLNELNSRFYYLPSKLCISNLQPTFKTLSPATYLLDRFGHPLRSVWILLALTLRPKDLEHSLSRPLNFGTNYLMTYTHARI